MANIAKGNYILAIDLGTSGPKVAIVNVRGVVLASSFKKSDLILQENMGAEQDPWQWWQLIKEAIGEVLKQKVVPASDICAICCTSQWSGTVAIDKHGDPLMNAIIWMDCRGSSYIKSLYSGLLKICGYNVFKLAHWLYKAGGVPGMAGKDPLAHILYIKNARPEIYQKTYKFLEPKDYLNFKFTGQVASSYDAIALHWLTDIRDINNVHYDPALLKMCQLPLDKFPDLFPATHVLGNLLPDLAQEWGLSPQVKVVMGGPDVQSAAIGSGAVEDFAAHLYIGTSSWITCHVPFKKVDIFTGIASLPSSLPGRYFVANAQESAGVCLGFLHEKFFKGMSVSSEKHGQQEQQQQQQQSERQNFELDHEFTYLEKMAGQSPRGSRNIIFTPWLNGERTPIDDHNVRGGFHNISLHNQSEDFVRSVYEGVAYNSKWLFQAIEKFVKRPLPKIHMIGGGAQSDVWCQIHADVLGRPIWQMEGPRHANIRGAAWIAAIGLGLLRVEEIEGLVKVKKIFNPTAEGKSIYQKQFKEFLNIYHFNKKIYRTLNQSYATLE